MSNSIRRIDPSDSLVIHDQSGRVIGIQPAGLSGPITFHPYVLAQSAVPVILPSSGSSDAVGGITLTTALPYQPSGVVRIYLPAGVVTAGSAGTGAGLYPVVFSSTTVCQIQGTGIVTANGAYTQVTTEVTLLSTTVPGGAMGANGVIRQGVAASYPNNANSKVLRQKFGANTTAGGAFTTSLGINQVVTVRNKNSQSAQYSVNSTNGDNAPGGAVNYTTVDTSANFTVGASGQLAVATDYIILEGYTVEVLPGF